MSSLRLKEQPSHADVIRATVDNDILGLRALLQTGVNIPPPDERGDTLLHHAARVGSRGTASILASTYELDTLARNKEGKTPLNIATENGFADMGTIFLKIGPEVCKPLSIGITRVPMSTSPFLNAVPQLAKEHYAGVSEVNKYFQSVGGQQKSSPTATLVRGSPSTGARGPHLAPLSMPTDRTDSQIIRRCVQRFGIFAHLPESSVREMIAFFEPQVVNKGDVIMNQGEPPHYLYVATKGTFRVSQSLHPEQGELPSVINDFKAPGCFGELAFLLNTPRIYTVTCIEDDSIIYRLHAQKVALYMARSEEIGRAELSGLEASQWSSEISPESFQALQARSDGKSRDSVSSAQSSSQQQQHLSIFQRFKQNMSRKARASEQSNQSRVSSRSPVKTADQAKNRDRSISNASSVHSYELEPSQKPHDKLTKKKSRSRSGSAGAQVMHAFTGSGNIFGKLFNSHKSSASAKASQFVDTSPDKVLRAMGKDGSGPVLVMAGTVDALLSLLIDPEYTDDVHYPTDFFLTYREFCSPDLVYKRLTETYLSSHDTVLRERILRHLCLWTRTQPFPTDPKLFENRELIQQLLKFTDLLPQKDALTQILKSNLWSVPSLPPPIDEEKATSIWWLKVEITKPGGIRDDMEYRISPNVTLRHIRDCVCQESRQRAAKFYNNENSMASTSGSGGKHIFMDPTAYQFRAVGFGIVIPLDVNVMEAGLHVVRLVPLKAYSAGMQIADDIDAELVAQQLTLLDFDTFSRLSPDMIQHQAWRRSAAATPYVTELTDRFNKVCVWAIEMVLGEKASWERAKVIGKLIDICNEFYDLKNFHGVFQIQSALKHASIARLKNSWKHLNSERMDLFRAMEKIIDPQNNRGAYREKLALIPKITDESPFEFVPYRRCEEPTLPYLGVFMSDFTFAEENSDSIKSYVARDKEEASADRSDDLELVNFFKFRGISRLKQDLRMYQRTRYSRAVVNRVEPSHIRFLRWYFHSYGPWKDDDELFELSLQREPKMTAEDKLSKEDEEGKVGGSFTWKTVQDRGFDILDSLADAVSSVNSSSAFAAAVGASKMNHYIGNKPVITYVGSMEHRTEDSNLKKNLEKVKKRAKGFPLCYCDIKDDTITFTEKGTQNIVLARPLSSISFYRYDPDDSIFFIVDEAGEENIAHYFQGEGHAVEDVYISFYRNMQKWLDKIRKASNEARSEAVERLTNSDFPPPDGAFVLRDSTTRPGCYALTLKHNDTVTHFLIERSEEGVRFKDSPLVFETLTDLIRHHCVDKSGLPVRLVPEGSSFLTKDCERFPSNALMDPDELINPRPEFYDWFFANFTRADAEDLLERQGMIDGMFLVRVSGVGGQNFALSFALNNSFYHVLITETEEGFYIEGKFVARSLAAVVEICRTPGQSWLPITLGPICPRIVLGPVSGAASVDHSASSQGNSSNELSHKEMEQMMNSGSFPGHQWMQPISSNGGDDRRSEGLNGSDAQIRRPSASVRQGGDSGTPPTPTGASPAVLPTMASSSSSVTITSQNVSTSVAAPLGASASASHFMSPVAASAATASSSSCAHSTKPVLHLQGFTDPSASLLSKEPPSQRGGQYSYV